MDNANYNSNRRHVGFDCANAQADLNLRWAHVLEDTFSHVTAQFVFCYECIVNMTIGMSFRDSYHSK